jgi:hypothetical protein
MTISYVSEGSLGPPATLSDAQVWANNYGHQGLVVISNYMDVWYPFGIDVGGGTYQINLPGILLVGPGMEIAKMTEPTIQEIELVIPGPS